MKEYDMNEEKQATSIDMSETTTLADKVSERYKLDEHIIVVWRLHLLLFFILYAVIAIIVFISSQFFVGIIASSLFFIDLAFRFIRAQFVYDNSSFAFGIEDIRFKTGYIFLRETLVPYPRIQHIDIHQGPIERYFNLSSLIIHTAGQSGDSIKIPGLQTEYAEYLRTYLKSFIKSEEEDT